MLLANACILYIFVCKFIPTHGEGDFNFSEGFQVIMKEPSVEQNKELFLNNIYMDKYSECLKSKGKITLSLVFKWSEWMHISRNNRSNMLYKLSSFFAIPKEYITIGSVTKRELQEMSKVSIKKGHPKFGKYKILGKIDFVIGCDKLYFDTGKSILKQIALRIEDESINELFGVDFVWWVIWNKLSNYELFHRYRRQAEGSGEDEYDYEYKDEDDEDELEENITEIPRVTTHAHRHHHGISKQRNDVKNTVMPIVNEDHEGPAVNLTDHKILPTSTEIPTTELLTSESVTQPSELDTEFMKSTSPTVLRITASDLTHTNESKEEEKTITSIPHLFFDGLTSFSPAPKESFENESLLETQDLVELDLTTVMSSSISYFESQTKSIELQAHIIESTTLSPPSGSVVTADYGDFDITNTPPIIRNRLQKMAVTAGKLFNITVPLETFYDNEDGTNLRLELLDKNGDELKSSSWVQFNAEKREIYGLPLEEAVSKWQYKLAATDSFNETVIETVDISVQQHKGYRSINHEVSIEVKFNTKFLRSIDWHIKLIEGIVTTLGDKSALYVVVTDIRQSQLDPKTATFVYTNDTLPKNECPDKEINEIVSILSENLSKSVEPELIIRSVIGQTKGPCLKQPIQKPKPTSQMMKNYPPVPRNQVDRVNATVGHLLLYKVPSDTFYDPNDTTDLKLSLLTSDRKEISKRYWLQFDSKNHEFYGIPKIGDIGSEEYLLVAEDSDGLTATDALVVVVSHAPKRDYSVYFKAHLNVHLELFNAEMQRKFVERIALFHGDSTTDYIQIRSLTTHHDSEGTIVNFYNTTLYKSHNHCPEDEIEAVKNVYLHQNLQLRDRAKTILGSELNLTNLQVIPLGSCHYGSDIIHRDIMPIKTDEPNSTSAFTDNYLFTYILPAIIITTMITFASVIACVLYRRRLSGKLEMGDDEERKSFRSKGIPVIFQDELDEKPEIGNKSPIILKDEKPPLLQMYNNANCDGENDLDEYVPPPAVVVGCREIRGKSPVMPSYRKPPPYVSP